MEKLKIIRNKEQNENYIKAIRVSVEADEILSKVSAETGKSKTDIAVRMIKFAYRHLEIIEEEEY